MYQNNINILWNKDKVLTSLTTACLIHLKHYPCLPSIRNLNVQVSTIWQFFNMYPQCVHALVSKNLMKRNSRSHPFIVCIQSVKKYSYILGWVRLTISVTTSDLHQIFFRHIMDHGKFIATIPPNDIFLAILKCFSTVTI